MKRFYLYIFFFTLMTEKKASLALLKILQTRKEKALISFYNETTHHWKNMAESIHIDAKTVTVYCTHTY